MVAGRKHLKQSFLGSLCLLGFGVPPPVISNEKKECGMSKQKPGTPGRAVNRRGIRRIQSHDLS